MLEELGGISPWLNDPEPGLVLGYKQPLGWKVIVIDSLYRLYYVNHRNQIFQID